MALSLNKIMLIGQLGGDAETRYTQNNQGATSFSLATSHGYKQQDGQWKNETTWHNIVAWQLSDNMKDHLKKGAKFYVEGRIAKRDYTNKEGNKIYVTEVIAEKLIPLGAHEKSENTEDQTSVENNQSNSDDSNDDLPF